MKFFKETPPQKTGEVVSEENKNIHAYVIEQELKATYDKAREIKDKLRPLLEEKEKLDKKIYPLKSELNHLDKQREAIREKYGVDRVSTITGENYNSKKQDWFVGDVIRWSCLSRQIIFQFEILYDY